MVSAHLEENDLASRPPRQNWGKFNAHKWGGFNARSQRPARSPAAPAQIPTPFPPLIAARLAGLHAQPFEQGRRKAVKSDIYQRVTDQIVASLETGVRPWMKPWSGEHAAGRITRPLRSNLIPYQGINILMLWGAAMEKGYAAPIWLTFKHAQALGGRVRKGEHGSLVVFASTFTRTEADEKTGDEAERDIPFLKSYTVFNAEQIDGLPAHYLAPAAPRTDPVQRIDHAERFFAATGATVRNGGDQAFYRISADHVQMPHFESFRDAESYYAVLAHELTHNADTRIMPRRTFRGPE
jgi:antirestriction protein ArdC